MKLAAIALVLASAFACSRPAPSPSARPATKPSAVVFPSGRSILVELAVDDEERARGLMYRESLADDRGLLFLFERPASYPFWMKNCRFPIDIVWLDADRRFVSAVYRVPPCRTETCPNYTPAGPAMFVIEVVAGVAEAEHLAPGDRFVFRDLPADRLPLGARAAALAP